MLNGTRCAQALHLSNCRRCTGTGIGLKAVASRCGVGMSNYTQPRTHQEILEMFSGSRQYQGRLPVHVHVSLCRRG